jgi:hydrogenase expression/formation protein HypE
MKLTADQSNIKIVTGDTKVVEKNKGDGVYINTTGVGIIEHNLDISAGAIKPDDTILISSSVGRHGMAIMARRNNLEFTPEISSDCRPLHNHVLSLINAGIKVKCLRDATRGGLASTLNELALEAGVHIQCEQNAIPVDESVSNACEILGIDPYHVANEGCFIAFIDKKDTSKALDILKEYNQDAALIGHVKEKREGVVTLITSVGGERVIDIPSGELLPRIC